MQTRLPESLLAEAHGQAAERILRACVHCGFCLATCPTYQLLGSELDSPRGRIYLIKQLLEGGTAGTVTRRHLDRCLNCRSCETTCPSGVRYSALLQTGRERIEQSTTRPLGERIMHRLLRLVVPYRRRFATAVALGRLVRPLLPARWCESLPPRRAAPAYTAPDMPLTRRVLLAEGCVQPTLTPGTNAAARHLLARLGIEAYSLPAAGCCGALSHHATATDEARAMARRNIDAWWPELDAGRAEALLVTASGCGLMVKEYDELLRDDPAYAARAARVAAAARDPVEFLAEADLAALGRPGEGRRIAFHPPCTLQHGQRLAGVTERLLSDLGFELWAVADSHLCCGSAGSYSLLQPAIAMRLRALKLEALQAGGPTLIATANVGCQHHLQAATGLPVRHWLEVVAEHA